MWLWLHFFGVGWVLQLTLWSSDGLLNLGVSLDMVTSTPVRLFNPLLGFKEIYLCPVLWLRFATSLGNCVYSISSSQLRAFFRALQTLIISTPFKVLVLCPHTPLGHLHLFPFCCSPSSSIPFVVHTCFQTCFPMNLLCLCPLVKTTLAPSSLTPCFVIHLTGEDGSSSDRDW